MFVFVRMLFLLSVLEAKFGSRRKCGFSGLSAPPLIQAYVVLALSLAELPCMVSPSESCA